MHQLFFIQALPRRLARFLMMAFRCRAAVLPDIHSSVCSLSSFTLNNGGWLTEWGLRRSRLNITHEELVKLGGPALSCLKFIFGFTLNFRLKFNARLRTFAFAFIRRNTPSPTSCSIQTIKFNESMCKCNMTWRGMKANVKVLHCQIIHIGLQITMEL